jgi:hypothetical protein
MPRQGFIVTRRDLIPSFRNKNINDINLIDFTNYGDFYNEIYILFLDTNGETKILKDNKSAIADIPSEADIDDKAILEGKKLHIEGKDQEYISGFIHGMVDGCEWLKIKLNLK